VEFKPLIEGVGVPPFLARYRKWIVAVVVCYWIAIFVGTHLPKIPQGIEGVSDKFLHFGAYAGLSGLLALIAAAYGRLSMRLCLKAFVVVVAYGVIDEISQIPVGRDCSVWDWLADIAGSCIGFSCFAVLWALIHRPRAANEGP